MAGNPVHILTDFSCCEDFENFLFAQNHANRELLDTLTQSMVDDWNGKACNIAIMGGNLCLLDKDGKNLAAVPMLVQDGDTITRDPLTGKITCIKVKVMGLDKPVNMWMGSRAQYEALKNKSPADTVYFFTDISLYDVHKTLDTVSSWVTNVSAGNVAVPKAKHAEEADKASEANYTTNANYASIAGTASIAWDATHATNADNATNAQNAENAKNSTYATNAQNAVTAASAAQLVNNGTVFSRKSVWNGSKAISAGSYADLVTTEAVNGRYIIVEADSCRTLPLRFDTSKYTSIERLVEGMYMSVYMDNTNNKKVRVYNKGSSELTVTNIFVEA